jgi:hypothetical protein
MGKKYLMEKINRATNKKVLLQAGQTQRSISIR